MGGGAFVPSPCPCLRAPIFTVLLTFVFSSYELDSRDDQLGSGVGCVVRCPPDVVTLERDQLECDAVNWQQTVYTLADHEEQISSLITLKPANSTRLVFDVSIVVIVRPLILITCPIAIAYSMGQIIKSVCICLCVCVSVRLRALSRSHFLIDFHQNWHRRKNPQK